MEQEYDSISHSKGERLTDVHRKFIKNWRSQGFSVAKIAKLLNVHRSTVYRELKRGQRVRANGTATSYDPELAQFWADMNKKRNICTLKAERCKEFIDYVIQHFFNDRWSFDACFNRALLYEFDRSQMVSVKTLYNYVDRNPQILGIRNIDLPEKMRRSPKRRKKLKKPSRLGRSIEQRPESVNQRQEFGHWEIDTVQGKKGKGQRVVMTLVERVSRYNISVIIDDKTSECVNAALEALFDQYGRSTFRSITADNGSEFAWLSQFENRYRRIYFAHPYSSYERGSNERHNRMLRRDVPKGKSINKVTQVAMAKGQDIINNTPRRILKYRTSKEVFDQFVAIKPQYHQELLEAL